MSHRESGRDADGVDYFDGGGVEDYEDSTRVLRPSEAGNTKYAKENIEKAVDAVIVKLRRSKVPFWVIGRVLNRDDSVVVRRFNRIPERARKYYEQVEMV